MVAKSGLPDAGRFVARLWWVVSLLLVLLSLVVGQSILTSLRQHEEQAIVETYSVAHVLESDLTGLFDKLKLALHAVASARERDLAAPRSGGGASRDYIAVLGNLLPDAAWFVVSDAGGRIVVDREFPEAPSPGIESRPYFARLRETCFSGMAISPPLREGKHGPWMIEVARRIEHSDGRFAGAAVAALSIDRLVAMLAAADTGGNGSVTLYGENLAILARHPAMADPASGSGAASDELRELAGKGEISGTFRAISRVDGVDRTYSYRRLGGYPLHITVGRSASEHLGHWRRDMGIVAILAGVLFLVTIAATAMIHRAWRRQRRVARLLEMQAHTDALTGLANRRHFFEMAEAELLRTRRYDAPLSLLMIDIDHFKEMNDTHGHRAGDRVLQNLARTCLEVLRNVDVAGRVGGEEFAVLLPETELAGAMEVAERLREAVEKSAVDREEGRALRITVSVGVAILEAHSNLDTLLSQADTALYDAKHQGRNRVCAFTRKS